MSMSPHKSNDSEYNENGNDIKDKTIKEKDSFTIGKIDFLFNKDKLLDASLKSKKVFLQESSMLYSKIKNTKMKMTMKKLLKLKRIFYVN
jgi:hypothetical protein